MIFVGACGCNIMRHGTLEILQLCHLGICMYTMETRKGLKEYTYTLHIEEGYPKALDLLPPTSLYCIGRLGWTIPFYS